MQKLIDVNLKCRAACWKSKGGKISSEKMHGSLYWQLEICLIIESLPRRAWTAKRYAYPHRGPTVTHQLIMMFYIRQNVPHPFSDQKVKCGNRNPGSVTAPKTWGVISLESVSMKFYLLKKYLETRTGRQILFLMKTTPTDSEKIWFILWHPTKWAYYSVRGRQSSVLL